MDRWRRPGVAVHWLWRLVSARSLKSLALASAVAGIGLALAASPAWAEDPFPIQEGFTNTAFGTSWRHGGSAELTAKTVAEDGTGWLRLTPAEDNKFGYAYDDDAFPSVDGALVEFEYADWGGTGADGLTFFFFNGNTTEGEFHTGQAGGSLGYAPCHSETNGLTKAYIGVGFDEYGNFTNLKPLCGLDGEEFLPNHVSVRGSEAEKYKLLTTVATTESLKAERSQARHVSITVTPAGKLSVYIRYPDGTYQTVTENYQLPAAPATLKFGYVGSTGGSTDDHEIRQVVVVKPTQLTPTVQQTGGGHEREEPLTWTAVVNNEGPNPTKSEHVSASTGSQTLSNVSWTCEGVGGAECPAASGTGLPNAEGGAMPEGSNLIFKITGTPPAGANYAQMTIESKPTGDTGELDPEKETATAITNLTPLFNTQPSFTLAASGLATATPGTALGGGVSYAYHWQRCEPNGESCTDIAGAEAITYHTTSADRGHTIRFSEIATNTAASTTAYTPAYEPLPATTITAAPSRYVGTGTAVFSFTTATAEASFECQLDSDAWEACGSPKEYTGLTEGRHTFSVRAVYGGLSDPNPPMVEWTVETAPPPKPTITPGHASLSPSDQESFTFGELVSGDTLECQLDGGAWEACTSPTEYTGLANGSHELNVRQVNKAGIDSEVASYTWTIDTTPPRPPTITSAPSSPSAQTNPVFTFGDLEEGDTLECRLHGQEWARCNASTELTGLSDGEHKLEARQVSPAGVDSEVTAYTWTIDATPPPPPTAILTPEAESTQPGGRFEFSHEPGTTVECSVNGGPYVECTAGLSLTGLSEGWQTVTARQLSAAGVVSQVSTYRWHVGARATPRGPATRLTARLGARATVRDNRTVNVGCLLNRGALHVCTVRAYHDLAGHWMDVGYGRVTIGKTGPRAGVVHVALNALGRRLLVGRLDGLYVTLETEGSTFEGSLLHANELGVHLYPQHILIIPIVWPFETARSLLVGQARRIVEHAAQEIRHARRVTCIGNTDDRGTFSYNLGLGLRRAQTVCRTLRALGVHARFKLETRGDGRPLAANDTAAGRALNRRVELLVSY